LRDGQFLKFNDQVIFTEYNLQSYVTFNGSTWTDYIETNTTQLTDLDANLFNRIALSDNNGVVGTGNNGFYHAFFSENVLYVDKIQHYDSSTQMFLIDNEISNNIFNFAVLSETDITLKRYNLTNNELEMVETLDHNMDIELTYEFHKSIIRDDITALFFNADTDYFDIEVFGIIKKTDWGEFEQITDYNDFTNDYTGNGMIGYPRISMNYMLLPIAVTILVFYRRKIS
jgi:hypothetical protein